MVSTSGSDPDDFTKISEGDYMEVPVDWTEYTYSLSAFAGETGHVAINYVSNDSFIFMLDNFKVTAEEDTPEDLIYTATLNLEAGEYQYKYFRNETWAHGEWDGDPNRVVVVEGDMEVNDVFGYIPDPVSHDAFITEFSFDEGQEDVTIDGFTIIVRVAVGTDITSLTPSITISEKATIDYEYPTAMNFTDSQQFVVTAEDGETTNTYTVFVRTVGVEENLLANLSVYPNPFGNQISVRNAEGVNRVIITNLIGQVVMDTPLTSETINTSKLSNGVYMVIFQGRNGERVVRKMVKN
ncbi:MAG TPA: T9SS type A sorting domain-containing protein, partial [Tenuifilaceae bacterium]|nr:T9SS type A sorting domain-containing protein [Tenuifilaceae bacterium]